MKDERVKAWPKTIALVGLMGAGKTCIGRKLANALNMNFVDADHEIEAAAGCSISDFFSLHGEQQFREGERKVIRRLLDQPPQILATGGGAYIDPETRQLLGERALTIWLKADLDLLLKRVQRRNDRPLLQNVDPRQKLTDLMAQRYPIYSTADMTIESVDGPPELTLDRVLAALKARQVPLV